MRAGASDNLPGKFPSDEILLDGRLALFHQREHWLAVADLHFGYELSQRVAGRLVPMWGMASIAERLMQLVDEYEPRRLIILGDLAIHLSARDCRHLRGAMRAARRLDRDRH